MYKLMYKLMYELVYELTQQDSRFKVEVAAEVRLSEKLGMRSIILSRLELELKSESSNTMNRT